MSDLTVDTDELQQLADDQDRAAAQADWAAQATESSSVDLPVTLYVTHGVVSSDSNDAVVAKAQEREGAARAIQQACLALAAALGTAESAYSETDSATADNLDGEIRS